MVKLLKKQDFAHYLNNTYFCYYSKIAFLRKLLTNDKFVMDFVRMSIIYLTFDFASLEMLEGVLGLLPWLTNLYKPITNLLLGKHLTDLLIWHLLLTPPWHHLWWCLVVSRCYRTNDRSWLTNLLGKIAYLTNLR